MGPRNGQNGYRISDFLFCPCSERVSMFENEFVFLVHVNGKGSKCQDTADILMTTRQLLQPEITPVSHTWGAERKGTHVCLIVSLCKRVCVCV